MGKNTSKDKEIDKRRSIGQYDYLSNHIDRAIELYSTSKAISIAIGHENKKAKILLDRIQDVEKMAEGLIKASGLEHILISKRKFLKPNKKIIHESEVIAEDLQAVYIANVNLGFAVIELAKWMIKNHELDFGETLIKSLKSNYDEKSINNEIKKIEIDIWRNRILNAIDGDDANSAHYYYIILVETDSDAGDYLRISEAILAYAISCQSIQLLVLVYEFSKKHKSKAVMELNNIRESVFMSQRSILSLCSKFLSSEFDDYCDKILKPLEFKDFGFIENLEIGTNNPNDLIYMFNDIMKKIRYRPNYQKLFLIKLIIKTIRELFLREEWESSALAIKQLLQLDPKEYDRKIIVNNLFTNIQLMQEFLKDSRPTITWRSNVEIAKGTNQELLIRNVLVSKDHLCFVSIALWNYTQRRTYYITLGFNIVEVGTGKVIVKHDIFKNQDLFVRGNVVNWLESKFCNAEIHYNEKSHYIEIVGTTIENRDFPFEFGPYNQLVPDPIKIPARNKIETSRLERRIIPTKMKSNLIAYLQEKCGQMNILELVYVPGNLQVIAFQEMQSDSARRRPNEIEICVYDLHRQDDKT
ncbi:MAG: hypothetical protein ISR58_15210 [Anaerolineales bacterium]|nr:hypothetical protein [Chloroflexota bacterium]MBL6982526.1 hypothetical protein [Anaerolineales bacterium]